MPSSCMQNARMILTWLSTKAWDSSGSRVVTPPRSFCTRVSPCLLGARFDHIMRLDEEHDPLLGLCSERVRVLVQVLLCHPINVRIRTFGRLTFDRAAHDNRAIRILRVDDADRHPRVALDVVGLESALGG